MVIKSKEKFIDKLPSKTGVYLFKNPADKVLYVGKAMNLRQRVTSYFENRSHLGKRTAQLLTDTEKIDYILVESEIEALLLEANLIKKHKPYYNTQNKDDTSSLYIRITKEPYPRVMPDRLPKNEKLRQKKEKEAEYFGPFISGKTVRETLKIIRRIFPYCSAKKIPSKACFYYGIGLCLGPCAGIVSKLTYRKMISGLKLFLSGKKKQLFKKLEKQMKRASDLKQYEEAAFFRDQINKIRILTTQIHKPQQYLDFPDLLRQTYLTETEDLRRILAEHIPGLLNIKRIEAYDISNIGGKLATGSCVVFLNGEPAKDQYRRFRIKQIQGKANDPKMMGEVINRRLKHAEWPLPDLILVDGGKGQISEALSILSQQAVNIPIVGIAKKNENLIIKNEMNKYEIISMPRQSGALKLLQRIRDESHRFALIYHRKLRYKDVFDKPKASMLR